METRKKSQDSKSQIFRHNMLFFFKVGSESILLNVKQSLKWNNLKLLLWPIVWALILTQSWPWWQCWQCSWHWTPHSRSWAPTWFPPPPGRSMYRRRGLENNVRTLLDAISVWELFNHLGDAETPQRWCNWLSATAKYLIIKNLKLLNPQLLFNQQRVAWVPHGQHIKLYTCPARLWITLMSALISRLR